MQAIQAAKAIVAFTHLSGPGKEELKRASRGWNLKQQKLVTFSDTTWWTLTDLGGSVSVNRKAISTMCQEVLKHDHWAVVTNLTDPEYKICADLFKVLSMPRTLQRYLEGGKYVTISNIDLAVCGMLQTLALVQANDSVRPEVRVWCT